MGISHYFSVWRCRSYFLGFFFLFLCIFYFHVKLFWVFCHKTLMFLWSTRMFSIFNHPIYFMFAPTFKSSRLETDSDFYHTLLWIAILNEFYNTIHFFNFIFSAHLFVTSARTLLTLDLFLYLWQKYIGEIYDWNAL